MCMFYYEYKDIAESLQRSFKYEYENFVQNNRRQLMNALKRQTVLKSILSKKYSLHETV